MTPKALRRSRRVLSVLAVGLGCFSLLGRPAPEPPPPPPEPCLIFARWPGAKMHSNQALFTSRAAGLARALGCRLLPPLLSMGSGGWADYSIPLAEFFEPSRLFVDMANAEDAAFVARAVSWAAGEPVSPSSDRAAMRVAQSANKRPLDVPCLVDRLSLIDPRFSGGMPAFRCSARLLLEPWATHAPHAADNPSARPSRELITFRREFGGGLVGVPDLVGLNVSCATEIRGSAEMPPRQELLRAAKFALWKFVLGREDPSDAERLLEAWGGAPPVSSLAYARYPDPAPALVTAHLRSGFNHQQYCYARMRFPLCATSDALSAQHLAPLLSGCGSQVVALLAGDTLTGAFGKSSLPSLLPPLLERPHPRIVYTRDLARAYLAALRHPSLNFTHHRTTTWINYYGTNAENAYYSLAAILIDQVLLACGSAVPGGAYFRTHMSTFSWRAAILGSDVLSAVCLPSGTRLPTSFDAASTAADADAELHAFAEAGVDLAAEHKAPPGNVTRRTMGPGAWHVGCTATGRFLPSLPFEDRRRGDPKGAGKCSSCGDSRW